MKLFFDEDMGRSVPEALKLVASDFRVDYVSNKFKRRIKKGTPDEVWIPYCGNGGHLVISCNKAILEAEAQRNLFEESRVGAVFLTTGQGQKLDVLLLLLKKLDWLRTIDSTIDRPFGYTMTIGGRTRKIL